MADDFKYELPPLPDELKFAKTEKEKQYLSYIKNLLGKLQRDFSTGLLHKEEFERRRDKGDTGVYIFIDGDGLKKINDVTQDHGAGDAAIKAIARGINNALRSRDDVEIARMGGDEFVVFLPNVSTAVGANIGKRILESIRNTPVEYKGDDLEVGKVMAEWDLTASIGVGKTKDEADRAMYKAKANGRNRVEFHNPSKDEGEAVANFIVRLKKQGKANLAKRLKEALEEK